MKITKGQTKYGVWIIVFACIVFFIGYWALLLEPLQISYNESRKMPPLIPFILFGLVDGFVFAGLTFIGFWIGGVKDKAVPSLEFKLDDLVENRSFWLWGGLWAILFTVFTLLWRGQVL